MKRLASKVLAVAGALSVIGVPAFASGEGTESLIPESVMTLITDFAAKIPTTVVSVVTIVVGAGLMVWGISFVTKKGINALKKQAGKAL